MGLERLQKLLARAGVTSRRAAEQLIVRGRIKVDGKVVTELGAKADLRAQSVELDGRRLMPEPLAYVVLHKPRGYVTTLRDPEGRPTVAELVQGAGRLVPIGRLDFATSGVLLMTNDGDFAAALTHPRHQVPKTYVAKVAGRVEDADLEGWRQRVVIDGRPTEPASVRRLRWEGDKTWLEITIREGRNRQVRRLGEFAGSKVLRLARVSQAGITHDGLRPGEWRYLTADELVDLQRSYGVPRRVRTQVRGTEGKLVDRSPAQRGPKRATHQREETTRRSFASTQGGRPERERAAAGSSRGDGPRKRIAPDGGALEVRGTRGGQRADRGERGPQRRGGDEGRGQHAPRRAERAEALGERSLRRSVRGPARPDARGESADRASTRRRDDGGVRKSARSRASGGGAGRVREPGHVGRSNPAPKRNLGAQGASSTTQTPSRRRKPGRLG